MERAIDLYYGIGQRQSVTTPTATETSEETLLVEAARAGDRAAFGRLYDRYARMVHGIVLSRVPRTEVDDLVQDVFLFALRRLSTLRDAAAFGGWLAMIARNRALDYHRRLQETTEISEEIGGQTSQDAEAKAGRRVRRFRRHGPENARRFRRCWTGHLGIAYRPAGRANGAVRPLHLGIGHRAEPRAGQCD